MRNVSNPPSSITLHQSLTILKIWTNQDTDSSLVSSASSEPETRNSARHGAYDSVFRPSARAPQPPLCDQRLGQLQISKWTDVPITDNMAAAAISLYLETDHPVLGLFDDDLFLNDLVAHKRDFCSPLLVSALLCSSLVSRHRLSPPPRALFSATLILTEMDSKLTATSNQLLLI